jgi:hypothetical protein
MTARNFFTAQSSRSDASTDLAQLEQTIRVLSNGPLGGSAELLSGPPAETESAASDSGAA